jgi:glutamate/tyrosine decarboxylase-like PLP-dependent enzyme
VSAWPVTPQQAIDAVERWRDLYVAFDGAESLEVKDSDLRAAWDEFCSRLATSYPFFHPDYAGQMLKPPHPVAVAGYLAAMLVNPNNHALDGGPATSAMEKEVVAKLAAMFGLPSTALGHLTSGGTIANLEALWVGREMGAEAVLSSADAHYTHSRMAAVLGMPHETIPVDDGGRMDLDALERAVQSRGPCVVVATAGTTGLGRVDPVADLVELKRRHGFRLHVDAAYGGFFRTLVGRDILHPETQRHLSAIEKADSVVVDPHKHGLQPYGCGAVLFRDPGVGRVYRHDSPYTYFTSDDLHLGEISLECSRAGAAAAALWLTTQVFPLDASGIGRVLSDTLLAARTFNAHVRASTDLTTPFEPELDIVVYHPADADTASVDRMSSEVFRTLMNDPEPIFVSLYRMPAGRIGLPGTQDVRILRSVLMKPEHHARADHLVQRIEDAVRRTRNT